MAYTDANVLELEPHQEEAYANVVKLMKEKGKSAVVFPTGCGKSFVTLKYILEHPDERILFLSPRNAIKDQMYEYIIRYIGGDFRDLEVIKKEHGNQESVSLREAAKQYIPNMECMLYQTILGLGKKDSVDEVLEKLKPDLIIIDEMHHLKTKGFSQDKKREVINDEYIDDITIDEEDFENEEETIETKEYFKKRKEEKENDDNKWGEKFNLFLEKNPQAKLLGLSATPIRTDGTNVVERIFENVVASEISLLEAIEEGIIYPPKYVVPDFIKEEEFQTLLEKIEQAEGDIKVRLKEQYDELVKRSAEAPGIPELMQEYITDKNGKYIIFCKDINDMKEKMKKTEEWFGKIDSEPEVYGIHSKDNTSAKQLESFNKSESEHLKLMYCVGMIDEGVHLNNVSGVILTAKTGSRPTYLQRLGRAISSGKSKKQSLVIDLVNNNEILLKERNVQYGFEITDLEAMQKLINWIDEKNDGKLPVYEKEKTKKERTLALRLARLNNKYLKYVKEKDLIKSLDKEKKSEILKIIELGKSIGILKEIITIQKEYGDIDTDELVDKFLNDIEIRGVRKDFRKLLEEPIVKGRSNPYDTIIAIKKWMDDNDTTKPPSPTSKYEEEKKLGNSLVHIRSMIIKPYLSLQDEEEKRKFIEKLSTKKITPITEEQFKEILGIVKVIDENNLPRQLINIRNINAWIEKNEKKPSRSSKNEEEKKLGDLLHRIVQKLVIPYRNYENKDDFFDDIKEYGLTEEQFNEILQSVERIENNTVTKSLANARNILQWIKIKRKIPSRESKDEEELRQARALFKIKQNLLKPYLNAKTENDKNEYLEKISKRKKEPVSKEEFEEILEIIEEIERIKNTKKISSQEIGQTTYTSNTQECDNASETIKELMLDKKKQQISIR